MLDAWRTDDGITVRNSGATDLRNVQLVPGGADGHLAVLGAGEQHEFAVGPNTSHTTVTYEDSTGARQESQIRQSA